MVRKPRHCLRCGPKVLMVNDSARIRRIARHMGHDYTHRFMTADVEIKDEVGTVGGDYKAHMEFDMFICRRCGYTELVKVK